MGILPLFLAGISGNLGVEDEKVRRDNQDERPLIQIAVL